MFDFGTSKDNVAVFVDGPNMIRREFDIDLDALRERIRALGEIKVGEVFLNQYASDKLIEAILAQGFSPELGLGEKDQESDVDVYMAVRACEAIYNENIDTVVIVTRDADFLPVFQLAKRKGKNVVLVAAEEGLSTALKHAADEVILLHT